MSHSKLFTKDYTYTETAYTKSTHQRTSPALSILQSYDSLCEAAMFSRSMLPRTKGFLGINIGVGFGPLLNLVNAPVTTVNEDTDLNAVQYALTVIGDELQEQNRPYFAQMFPVTIASFTLMSPSDFSMDRPPQNRMPVNFFPKKGVSL